MWDIEKDSTTNQYFILTPDVVSGTIARQSFTTDSFFGRFREVLSNPEFCNDASLALDPYNIGQPLAPVVQLVENVGCTLKLTTWWDGIGASAIQDKLVFSEYHDAVPNEPLGVVRAGVLNSLRESLSKFGEYLKRLIAAIRDKGPSMYRKIEIPPPTQRTATVTKIGTNSSITQSYMFEPREDRAYTIIDFRTFATGGLLPANMPADVDLRTEAGSPTSTLIDQFWSPVVNNASISLEENIIKSRISFMAWCMLKVSSARNLRALKSYSKHILTGAIQLGSIEYRKTDLNDILHFIAPRQGGPDTSIMSLYICRPLYDPPTIDYFTNGLTVVCNGTPLEPDLVAICADGVDIGKKTDTRTVLARPVLR